MWVRYWCNYGSSKSSPYDYESYELQRDDLLDDQLKCEASERVPMHLLYESHTYGFERVICPPQDKLEYMINNCKKNIIYYKQLEKEYQRWLNLKLFI
jgi:hypothetical protein